MLNLSKHAAKSKFSLLYCLVFLVGIVSLTQFFGAHSYFAVNRDSEGLLVVLLSIMGFSFSMIFMTYKIYAEEKAKNNLRVSFAPYDRLYAFLNEFTTKGAKN